jgi:putative FmdB family regulatory protein
MPVYVFVCHECGSFELARPMAQASNRACCPTCQSEARRVFTPPRLTRLATPMRRALETEEASAHEPRVVTEKRGLPLRQRPQSAPPWVLH